MVYDFCRSSIRVSWNIILVPKVPLFGMTRSALYLDGISHYKLDRTTGKIVEHKIENLIMNNIPIAPPYGILKLLQQELLLGKQRIGRHPGMGGQLPQPEGVPAGLGMGAV